MRIVKTAWRWLDTTQGDSLPVRVLLWLISVAIIGSVVWYFVTGAKTSYVNCYGDGAKVPYSECQNDLNR